MAELHRLDHNCQLLARVARGDWPQTPTQLNLDSVVKRALDERATWMHHRGVELHRSIKPVSVVLDLDLVTCLVLASVENAAKPGTRLFVLLETQNWPAHALLSFKTTHAVMVAGKPDHSEQEPDSLNWRLVAELARAMGVAVQTSETDAARTLTLEFTQTAKQVEGLTAQEADHGAGSWMSACWVWSGETLRASTWTPANARPWCAATNCVTAQCRLRGQPLSAGIATTARL